jgi:hypothetical protein
MASLRLWGVSSFSSASGSFKGSSGFGTLCVFVSISDPLQTLRLLKYDQPNSPSTTFDIGAAR